MKWYKKQLDKLQKESSKKKAGQSSDLKKLGSNKNTFSNPVAQRNRNRPKTDVY